MIPACEVVGDCGHPEEVLVRRERLGGEWWWESMVACLAAGLLGTVGCAPAASPVAVKPSPSAHEHGHDADEHDRDEEHADHDHDHDDHNHPVTVADGIDELEEVCRRVKESLAAGDLKKADDAVHMAGHLVEDLHKLVADWKPETGAKKALDDVFECFDAMDTVLHSGDEEAARKLDYAAYAPRIEAAIETLKKASAR